MIGYQPKVSVVMAAYNAEETLLRAVNSILNQENVDLEFIIVNDGSNDDSGKILQDLSELDSRVRIINQSNRGLTLSLISGCESVRGEYIARQDADDYSLPQRLTKQAKMLDQNPDLALCVCGTRVIAPFGETIDEIVPSPTNQENTRLLREEMRGIPSHGAVMMRRSAYQSAGGYRAEFYFSQDIDLWLRLARFGGLGGILEILYELHESVSSISGKNRENQSKYYRLARSCYEYERRGESAGEFLRQAAELKEIILKQKGKNAPSFSNFETSYRLIAKRLYLRGDYMGAKRYLRLALAARPFSLRIWYDFIKTYLGSLI